ncbi:glycine zipper domain-containing protein [Agarivorans sp. TSD2052]|uniref:YMGG-like glycine zipper-containing protein n=1 Tax=Agarivorans sp. TSD2052 TaxID=2937286 RepID=UPI00200E2125|nr:YMGG-like glycine zipper-containing protein [Agarivorans sp. TSD2052]UPW17847.1 glycine zipper domain-containing protein [Agarivorans sp. TSD2052]
MHKLGSSISIILLAGTVLVGCASTDDEANSNQGMKTGAIGGALVGLVMGAVTGEADLAVKGAAVGAAAGGVSGAMRDYENQQENRRTDTTAQAISQPNTVILNGDSNSKQGDHLNKLLGQWQVSIWAIKPDGSTIEAEGLASGKMLQSDTATIELDQLHMAGQPLELQASTSISYSEQQGHQLRVNASSLDNEQLYAGEYQAGMNRFSYYPLSQVKNNNMRMELRVVSPQLWLVETYAQQGNEEKMIQSYRFSKAG